MLAPIAIIIITTHLSFAMFCCVYLFLVYLGFVFFFVFFVLLLERMSREVIVITHLMISCLTCVRMYHVLFL